MSIRLGWFTNNVGLHILSKTEILQHNLKAAAPGPVAFQASGIRPIRKALTAKLDISA